MRNMRLRVVTPLLVFAMILTLIIPVARAQEDVDRPLIFQAAGSVIEAIQGTVDAY
jgi:hypothetical protein